GAGIVEAAIRATRTCNAARGERAQEVVEFPQPHGGAGRYLCLGRQGAACARLESTSASQTARILLNSGSISAWVWVRSRRSPGWVARSRSNSCTPSLLPTPSRRYFHRPRRTAF